ncbi:MAG TPA: hypothetical protein ENJ35_02315 [Gammaproteobacteria bacterium]|nr:hypothetical protein [Gammaproteobacteria bacterium]
MVVFLVLTNPANADAFLDTIRKEVHAVELDPVTQKTAASNKTSSGKTASEKSIKRDMPAGMSHEEFDSYLERSYRGSFSFYRRLTDDKKTEVFQAYVKQPVIQFIRNKIKKTYLNQ